MGPERRAASAPVSTAATPGSAAAALASMDTIRAWACGLRKHRHVEEAGQAEVVDEAAAARDEADVFLQRQRLAHPGRAHAVAPASARMASDSRRAPAAAACATARTMLT